MDKEDKFCLKWNDYSSNLEESFKEMRKDKMLFDVTLACGSTQIEAHRVVLSACSSFFREILKRNPHIHPLLYLRGVKLVHLEALMDFMYNGEVNVCQSDLSEFLSMAGDLKVKGLTPPLTGRSEDEIAPAPEPWSAGRISPSGKKRKSAPALSVRSDLIPPPQSPKNKVLKVEKEAELEDVLEDTEAIYAEQLMEEDNVDLSNVSTDDDLKFGSSLGSDVYDEHNAKVDLMVRSKMVETPDGWACAECGFSGTIRKVYQHVEMSHVSVQYYCQICQKVCKTRNSLFCHRYRYHRSKTAIQPEDCRDQSKSSKSFSPPNKTVVNPSGNSFKPSGLIGADLCTTNNRCLLAKIENE